MQRLNLRGSSKEAERPGGGWGNIPQGKDGTWIRMVITEVTKHGLI